MIAGARVSGGSGVLPAHSHRSRSVLALAGAVAAGLAGFITLSGTPADAQPLPAPPAPATVTQTVTVMPVAGSPAAAGVPLVPQTGPAQVAVPGAGIPLVPTAPVAPAQPVLQPATSGTLVEYLKSKNVAMQPQKADGFTALRINLPMPTGWSRVPDPNVPDAFLVTADRVGGDGLYTSNAQLTVYRLVGDFDAAEAITHGFVDSQAQPAWRTTDARMGFLGTSPSSLIEGTFRQNDVMLNTSRRHVIVASGPDKYLVSLAVTTSVTQAVAAGDATDGIVNGFQVSAATPGPAPAPVAASVPALAPPGITAG